MTKGDSNNGKSRLDQKSYRLSGEQLRSIYNETIYPRQIVGRPSVTSPCFVIICAQPGAGKSSVSSRLQNRFIEAAQQAVHVDIDDLRKFHAQLDVIMADDPMQMGNHTQDDMGVWKGFLLQDSKAAKNNIVMEISLKSADNTKHEIERFQKEGYSVELHAMAVHENVSRLGIFQRFEKAVKTVDALPRYVPLDYHDEAYHALPRNVDDIERNCGLNLVTVNNRAGDIVYKRDGQNDRPQAMEAILLERNRAWTQEEHSAYSQAWDRVIKSVQSRPASPLKPAFYLADLQKAFNLGMSSARIILPTPAVEQDLDQTTQSPLVKPSMP